MSCAHCCHNYGNGKRGKHMSVDTFKKVCELQVSEFATLGGGEPTLNPDFEAIIGIAISHFSEGLLVITNGSNKERALFLNRLAEKEVLSAELSWDEFHDKEMVDNKVYQAYAVRNALRGPGRRTLLNVGRAKKIDWYEKDSDECVCDDLQFYPGGFVKWCGCARSPILGNVHSEVNLNNYTGQCYKRKED